MTRGRCFLFRPVADEVLVFDRRSGDTHVLDPASAHVLSVLECQSSTIIGMAESLRRDLGLAHSELADTELREQLVSILEDLGDRELIERCRS